MNITQMTDTAIIKMLGSFIKKSRIQNNMTQAQLAHKAGLNRWTISQIENGESITLTTLIQILRALDSLHVLSSFEFTDTISPLEYAKLKKRQRERVRNSSQNTPAPPENDLEW